MQANILQQIDRAFAEALPTCVLSIYTPAYAEPDGLELCLRAGVRGAEDWLFELEDCTLQEAYQLGQKYGVANIHYLVDDSSSSLEEFVAALAQFGPQAATPKQVLVATHPEAGVVGVFATQAAWEQHCAVNSTTDLDEYTTEWLVVEG